MHPRNHGFHFLPAAIVLNVALLVAPIYAFQDFDGAKLQIASAQHNIIMLLLKDKDFNAVLPEFEKILNLRLPVQYEENIIREALGISEAFMKGQRADLSLRLLERGIQSMNSPKSKAALYQEMGYVYRIQGNDLKAMECFRRAQQLAAQLVTRPEY
jgi:tetratricopeptide (TPR) repeat protein